MVETVIFATKVTPIVFLAGLAIAPSGGFEDILLRTAAGVIALGAIYRVGVKPMYVSGRRTWMSIHALIVRFFEEHHHAVEAVARLESDVSEIKRDVKVLKESI